MGFSSLPSSPLLPHTQSACSYSPLWRLGDTQGLGCVQVTVLRVWSGMTGMGVEVGLQGAASSDTIEGCTCGRDQPIRGISTPLGPHHAPIPPSLSEQITRQGLRCTQ